MKELNELISVDTLYMESTVLDPISIRELLEPEVFWPQHRNSNCIAPYFVTNRIAANV